MSFVAEPLSMTYDSDVSSTATLDALDADFATATAVAPAVALPSSEGFFLSSVRRLSVVFLGTAEVASVASDVTLSTSPSSGSAFQTTGLKFSEVRERNKCRGHRARRWVR
ncbi:hypothetical protein HDU82_008204 [Entophlyctis luteolus]|nr:hypothetical protein HDU82_008204 [Entophlyctis luteolus]KAJ3394865.1 hypothetical protein HDU84_005800 [Entophlyctis sp. JEL0112]